MRLFAAIPVEGEVRRTLQPLLARWAATDWPVKWAPPDALHLTVKFLGEVAPDRLPGIVTALGDATLGTPALPLVLRELGAFPTLDRPRVLWAGLDGEAALELLADRVERACAALGFAVEGRPFRPHVTLGRVREGRRLPLPAIQQLQQARVAGQSVGDRLVLFESRTLPGGASYTERATFPLGI
jgi:2'-5' RNA ligase